VFAESEIMGHVANRVFELVQAAHTNRLRPFNHVFTRMAQLTSITHPPSYPLPSECN